MAKEPRTSDELRAEIDHGRTGDKVDFEDPAAAPLGTDAEAGGAPPDPDQVRRAWEHEAERRGDDQTAGRPGRRIPPRQFMDRSLARTALPWIAVLAVVLLVVLIVWI